MLFEFSAATCNKKGCSMEDDDDDMGTNYYPSSTIYVAKSFIDSYKCMMRCLG